MGKKSVEKLKIEALLSQVQTDLRLANKIASEAIVERDRLFAQQDMLTGLLEIKAKPVKKHKTEQLSAKEIKGRKAQEGQALDEWAKESVAHAEATLEKEKEEKS